MRDETATKLHESARDKLRELLRQETEIKEHISHWGPIVERLAKLAGEMLDPEIAARISQLNQENQASAGQEMGLTEAIRWVFRQPKSTSLPSVSCSGAVL